MLYKTNKNQEIVKNISLDSQNNYDQKLLSILTNFPNFNEMPIQDITSFGIILKSFMGEATKNDFDILFNNNFHQHLLEFLIHGSKPIVFANCVGALNNILENAEAKTYIHPFLEPSFANFIFLASTYIDNEENPVIHPIIYSSQNTIYSSLIQLLMNIFKHNLNIFNSFQPIFFFQRVCKLYQRDINISASKKAIEILIYILSQSELKFSLNEIEPIFQIAQKYFDMLVGKVEHPIVYSLESFPSNQPFQNCQGCNAKFDDFSKMCQLSIRLAQKDLNFFCQSININKFFFLLSYTNPICACSLIDLLIFILHLQAVPKQFLESISWTIVDQTIKNFNALNSNEPEFIVKICQLIEAITLHQKIQQAQLNDLLIFINNGSFIMQQEALRVTCNLFLNHSDQLLQLGFQTFLQNDILIAICNSIENTQDINYLKLLLFTLIKSIQYFQSINDNETISKVNAFCSSECFIDQLEGTQYEEIQLIQRNILSILAKNQQDF